MKRNMVMIFLGMLMMFGLTATSALAGGSSDLTLNFTGVNGSNAGGVYTGIYYGNLSGGTLSSPTGQLNFLCDDYQDEINFGENWNVKTYNIENLAAGPFSGVTFGDNANSSYNQQSAPQLESYAKALWIGQSLLENPSTPGSQQNVDSFAIWSLLNNSVNPANAGVDTSTEIGNANAWWSSVDNPSQLSTALAGLSNVNIYVPVAGTQSVGGPPQEFLGLTPGGMPSRTPYPGTGGHGLTATPEPVSLVLMGTFLGLAGGLMRKKIRLSVSVRSWPSGRVWC